MLRKPYLEDPGATADSRGLRLDQDNRKYSFSALTPLHGLLKAEYGKEY